MTDSEKPMINQFTATTEMVSAYEEYHSYSLDLFRDLVNRGLAAYDTISNLPSDAPVMNGSKRIVRSIAATYFEMAKSIAISSKREDGLDDWFPYMVLRNRMANGRVANWIQGVIDMNDGVIPQSDYLPLHQTYEEIQKV